MLETIQAAMRLRALGAGEAEWREDANIAQAEARADANVAQIGASIVYVYRAGPPSMRLSRDDMENLVRSDVRTRRKLGMQTADFVRAVAGAVKDGTLLRKLAFGNDSDIEFDQMWWYHRGPNFPS